jgi:hypothetical protein
MMNLMLIRRVRILKLMMLLQNLTAAMLHLETGQQFGIIPMEQGFLPMVIMRGVVTFGIQQQAY